MNREIKFRQYYQGDDDHSPEWNFFDLRYGQMTVDGGYEHPQQFTGLKDKNGQDIYEGDLIEHWWEGKRESSEVAYSPDYGCFYVGMYGDPNLTKSWIDSEQAVVVGNIYENPELIAA